jgi:hypothetical protein
MRKLLFALVIVAMGGFAFAGASPASAMTAGAVTGMSDIVKSDSTVDKVAYRCWWRYGHRHCAWYPGWRHHGWGHHRHCWWRYGRRYCRW